MKTFHSRSVWDLIQIVQQLLLLSLKQAFAVWVLVLIDGGLAVEGANVHLGGNSNVFVFLSLTLWGFICKSVPACLLD